jgi:opacity protein-like surface antigen
MKSFLIVAAATCLFAGSALADSCADQAAAKKLAGAAKTSFMTKCTKDAQASCDTQAADKKLAGAAKTSFTKKCVSDATGS